MASSRFFSFLASLLFLFCSAFHVPSNQKRRVSYVLDYDASSFGESSSPSTVPSSSSSSSCPFSRSFPRYRIDLTRSSKAKGKTNIFLNLILPGFQQQHKSLVRRQQLERQYSKLQWLADLDGVQAFTALWQATARIASSDDKYCSQAIALPECDPRILVNFKELMDWTQEFMPEQATLETTLIDMNALLIKRIGGSVLDGTAPIAISSSTIESRMKAWVKRLLVELSICPFTKSVTKSGQGLGDLGVPVGGIAYHASNSPKCVYQLMADTWNAMSDMLKAGPSGQLGVSSILLAAPAWDDDFEVWSGPFFCLLENSVVAAQAEAQLGVVCFHPQYATPDGTSWPGFGHMHSVPRLERWVTESEGNGDTCPLTMDEVAAGGAWQRRTPHATINVLRADQLEQAESLRSSSSLYARNIKVLVDIGNDELARALEREREINQRD